MFYLVLTIHLLAVAGKLIPLFVIPRLRNVEQTQRLFQTYKKTDVFADIVLWITGLGFFFVSSFEYVLQPWLIISMLIYVVIFYITKKILVRGMNSVVESGKLYAEKELKILRTQSYCLAIFIVVSLATIGYLMVNKPF